MRHRVPVLHRVGTQIRHVVLERILSHGSTEHARPELLAYALRQCKFDTMLVALGDAVGRNYAGVDMP